MPKLNPEKLTADQRRVLELVAQAAPGGLATGTLKRRDWPRVNALRRSGLVYYEDYCQHLSPAGRTLLAATPAAV